MVTKERNISIKNPRPETKVTEYLSASQNKNPLLYPGQRPESSYLTDGDTVYSLNPGHDSEGKLTFSLQTNEGEVPIDDFLRQHGAPEMSERIPVLAFGANMSPGSMAGKFAKVGREDAMIVPTVYARLHGRDVVWSGGPGVNGNFVAILYEGPETKDTDVQVGINFLTREQLLVLHATELSYELASVDLDIDGQSVRAFYYVGKDNVYLKDGSPVAVESIPATNRTVETSTTEELVAELLDNPDIMSQIISEYPELKVATPADFVSKVAEIKAKGQSLDLKRYIQKVITGRGLSKTVESTDLFKRRESWANPSTLPTLGDQQRGVYHHDSYRLPSEELGEWSNPEMRAKVLGSITTHLMRTSDGELKTTD